MTPVAPTIEQNPLTFQDVWLSFKETERLMKERAAETDRSFKETERLMKESSAEVDLRVVNDGTLVVVECKSRLTHEHVDEHLRRMEKFKRVMPLYKNHQALGAVAAMVMRDGVKEYAHSQGLYALCQNGDNMEISHPVGFVSKVWWSSMRACRSGLQVRCFTLSAVWILRV